MSSAVGGCEDGQELQRKSAEGGAKRIRSEQIHGTYMGMDQYLLIPFLGGWTFIYQLFWCSPGVQGFYPSPYGCMVFLNILEPKIQIMAPQGIGLAQCYEAIGYRRPVAIHVSGQSESCGRYRIPDMLGTLKKTSKLGRTWTQIKALLKLLRWTWRRKVGQKLYPVGDLASRTWQKGSVLICVCSRCIFMLENDWTNAEKTQAKSVLEVPRAS